MWQPEPGWQPMPGTGPASAGVWSAVEGGRPVVVKRLVAPVDHDPAVVTDPRDGNYWRRAADVALSGVVAATPGLREPPVVRVEEDEDGITLVHTRVSATPVSGLFVAGCAGRFAGAHLPEAPWLARGQLRGRLALVARRGGWTTLARTTAADVADHLWSRRATWLDRFDALPQVPVHGDLVPRNVVGHHGPHGLAVDWSHLGTGAVGSDLGYLALAVRENLDPMLQAYLDALPTGLATPEQVREGARVTAVYTALTRADWALARIAPGEGALAGKLRHPSVAPHLAVLRGLVPSIESLVG